MASLKKGNIVILAGGISSRMKASVDDKKIVDSKLAEEIKQKHKSMLTVGKDSRPFLDYLLNNISKAGYREVVIVVSERDSSIRDYYEVKRGSLKFPELSITYAIQNIPAGRTKPLGTADALLKALQMKKDWEGRTFSVCNSDNLYSIRALKLLLDDEHPNALIDYDRASLKFDQKKIEQFAIIRKDENGFLLEIVEKPSPQQITQFVDSRGRIGVSMNIFKFSYNIIYSVLEVLPIHPVRQEKELPQAVNMLVSEYPNSMYAIPLSEHVIDLTTFSDYSYVRGLL